MRFRNETAAALVTAGLCCGVAQADMVLTLDDHAIGGIEVIMADGQGVGYVTASGLVTTHADPDGTVDGIVRFTGGLGGGSVFDVNFSTGLSDPIVGSNANGRLDLSSVNVSGVGAGTLSISLTDTDFNQAGALPVVGEIGGTTDGSVSFGWAGDEGNNEFGFAGNTGLIIDGPFGPGAFSGTTNSLLTSAGAYSLSMAVEITHNAAGEITSFGTSLYVVPAPAGLAVLAFGLAHSRRRRRRAC